MIGIVPCAGEGKRVGRNKPFKIIKGKYLIEYPFKALLKLGITKCVVIKSNEEIRLRLGDNYEGLELIYVTQSEPKGIAHAVSLAEPYTNNEDVCLILGDIIYLGEDIKDMKKQFDNLQINALIGGRIEHKRDLIRESYGLKNGVYIEKPKRIENLEPFLGFGIYMFKSEIYNAIKKTDSPEITDVLNTIKAKPFYLKGKYWNINTIKELNKAKIYMDELKW